MKTNTPAAPAAHTPGPWYISKDGLSILCGDPLDPEIVCRCETGDVMDVLDEEIQEANAALIVRAVNSHAELVAVASAFIEGCERGEPVGEAFFSRLLDQARAALAKAKGGAS